MAKLCVVSLPQNNCKLVLQLYFNCTQTLDYELLGSLNILLCELALLVIKYINPNCHLFIAIGALPGE